MDVLKFMSNSLYVIHREDSIKDSWIHVYISYYFSLTGDKQSLSVSVYLFVLLNPYYYVSVEISPPIY